MSKSLWRILRAVRRWRRFHTQTLRREALRNGRRLIDYLVIPLRSPHRLGAWGERLACHHLKRRGYRILVSNWRFDRGEIDLVAADGDTLVFVEIKTRRERRDGAFTPLEAVGPAKRLRLDRAARAYLRAHPLRPHLRPFRSVRFDVVTVTIDPLGGRPTVHHYVEATGTIGCWHDAATRR